jgi:hypothetical protein
MNTTPIRPWSAQRRNFQRPPKKWWTSPESVLKGIVSNNVVRLALNNYLMGNP